MSRSRPLLAAGALVALVASSWSLSLSLALGLTPCDLCWYQRILMYPLVAVLGVAAWEDRPGVYRTALPLAVPGAALAAYHSYLQATATTCSVAVGCTAVQYTFLGLSTPNLALVAFLAIAGLVAAAAR